MVPGRKTNNLWFVRAVVIVEKPIDRGIRGLRHDDVQDERR